MAELLLTHDVYNQDAAAHPGGPLVPANPNQPLAPMEALQSVAEDPTNATTMEGLNTAAQEVARAKHAMESGVGRRNGRRSTELQGALRTLGDRAEAAKPHASQAEKVQDFLATLRVADGIEAAEHGEVPGRTANILSRIGGSAVMQRVARHARTLTRVYRTAGVALGLAGAAATIATGGTAAVAGVAAGAAIRTARGAVTGAGVAMVAERAARQQRNTSEAINNRNSEQERARNDFMVRNIKAIIGRPEDAPMSSDELAAHVNNMIPDQYQRLRDSLINHVVETSQGVRGQNNQMLRQAMGRGARRGAVGGFAAGGIEGLAHNLVPGVEHVTGQHDAVSTPAGPGTPTPEQINSAIQTAQEHSTGLMDHASSNYPDQGTLWATVQDHGASVGGHEHLTDAATENQILTGYGNMQAHGFGVDAHNLTLDQATDTYTPNSNDWWADVKTPQDGAWLVNGNTTDYIPGGAHLGNSQMAAIMDATQHGAHLESAQEFHDNFAAQFTHSDALQQGIDHAPAHVAPTPDVGELTANTVVDDLDAPTRWIEDMAAGAIVPSLEGAYLVNRAQTQVRENTEARNAAYDTERDQAQAIIDGIRNTIPVPAGASPAEQAAIVNMRLNAFAEAAFAHDSQVARYLANARARGLTQEDQAEQALLAGLDIAGMTPAELRVYLGESFNYRRELQEMSIDLAAAEVAAVVAAGGNVDANGNPVDAGGNPIIARIGAGGNPAGAELLPLAAASPEAQNRFNAFIGAMPNVMSRALNANDPIRQRMLLNTLRINGLDIAGMREGVARHDAEDFADRLGLRTGGRLPLENDPERSADRIETLYSTEYHNSPRGRLLLEVGVRTPDLLTRAADLLNIDGIDAGNLPQTLAYQGTMRRLNADLVGTAGNVDINGTGTEARDRLDALMGNIPLAASEALNSDDALREEMMRRALAIDNMDVSRLRVEIANRDLDQVSTDFEAHMGGPLGDTAGDPIERERRLAALYDDVLVNNPRRRMLLEMDSSTPGTLAPVMNTLHITDLAGGGLSAEEELNRDLSIRDLAHDVAPGAPRRPANWVGNQLSPMDGDFAPTVIDRLQDLISMASPRERAAIERWQSGSGVIGLIDVDTDTTPRAGAFNISDGAQWDALWTALEDEYNRMTGTTVVINRWEDAINSLPPRP